MIHSAPPQHEQGTAPHEGEASAGQIRALVEATVDRAVKEWLAKARWFLYGFGLLLVLLVANGLMARRALIEILHDQVFSFEESLTDALRGEVTVSYSSTFILSPKQGLETVGLRFYAHPSQTASAHVEIQHFGAGERFDVKIAIDDSTEALYQGHADWDHTIPELPLASGHGRFDEHELHFQVVQGQDTARDEALVKCLINVKGLPEAVGP